MNGEIKVIGVDKEKCRSTSIPELFEIYFILSEQPDREWASCYMEVHRNLVNSKRMPSNVSGKYIVVTCKEEDVARQLELIKEPVEQTNKYYQNYFKQKNAEEAIAEQERLKAKETFKENLDGLKFN